MAKKLIYYDNRYWKFSQEVFRKKLLPENSTTSLKERINDLIQTEEMTVSYETIKAWYYQNNSTTDIENIQKIAHYLDIPVTDLLIQTDEVMEHISAAMQIDSKRTFAAAADAFLTWLASSPSDAPDYEPPKNKLQKFKDSIPPIIWGIAAVVLFPFLVHCTVPDSSEVERMDFVYCSFLLYFFAVEFACFLLCPYFKTSWIRKIPIAVLRILEIPWIIVLILKYLSLVF